MPAGAAETVIEIDVTKGGIEIVPVHELNDATAEPDAFRVAAGAVDGLRGLGEFVDLALVVLGGVVLIRRTLLGLVLLLPPYGPANWISGRGGGR